MLGRLDRVAAEQEPANDAALLRAYAAGDGSAFARLYDRYDRSSFQFVSRMLVGVHAAVAEDVHQEVWVAIARSATSFDPAKGSFRTWLFTVTRRKVLDHFRSQRVVPSRADLDEVALAVSDPGPSPLEQVETRELAERLVRAVEALPIEQRSTFLMVADGGVSLEQVAQATGVPPETAKSRLRYARARLRQVLSGGGAANV